MTITAFALSTAATSLGVARAFIGDPFTTGGMTPLPTQGEIVESIPQNLNELTLPELTGEVPHSAVIIPGKPTVTVPVIWTGATLDALLSAHGSSHEGYGSPRTPTYTSLLIIPLSQLDTTADPPTISYNGTVWAPSAPTDARYYWKCIPRRPDFSNKFEGNGQVIVPVTFDVFYDANRPSGHRIRSYGGAAAISAGVSTLRH
jgi:hypothetical protein